MVRVFGSPFRLGDFAAIHQLLLSQTERMMLKDVQRLLVCARFHPDYPLLDRQLSDFMERAVRGVVLLHGTGHNESKESGCIRTYHIVLGIDSGHFFGGFPVTITT